jgi:hypothetical protein
MSCMVKLNCDIIEFHHIIIYNCSTLVKIKQKGEKNV